MQAISYNLGGVSALHLPSTVHLAPSCTGKFFNFNASHLSSLPLYLSLTTCIAKNFVQWSAWYSFLARYIHEKWKPTYPCKSTLHVEPTIGINIAEQIWCLSSSRYFFLIFLKLCYWFFDMFVHQRSYLKPCLLYTSRCV